MIKKQENAQSWIYYAVSSMKPVLFSCPKLINAYGKRHGSCIIIANCEQIRDVYFLPELRLTCGSILLINNGLIINWQC